jgi:hypothetical protein
MRNMSKIGALMLAGAALSGCGSLREAAGLTKTSPDEFAVTTKAPLVIPPGFNLIPPTPGAAPTNEPETAAAAQLAMFGGDPATVAANIPGNYSAGERMLLASAGVNRADPTIRQRLMTDRGGLQSADPSFTARLLGTAPTAGTGVINADAEFERRRGTTPAPTAATTRQSSGGWFDWF